MGPAVGLQNCIVEIFHSQRDARHPQAAQGLHLRLRQRAWLALKRHLLGIVPAKARMQPGHQLLQLLDGEKRRSSPSEIDILERATSDRRLLRHQRRFAGQSLGIPLDIGRGGVGVHAEIAELAPLATKRNVQIEAEGRGGGGLGKRLQHSRHRSSRPALKRRVVRHKVAAWLGRLAHRVTLAGKGGERSVTRSSDPALPAGHRNRGGGS